MVSELKFSIVIPTYNEENDIRATLDSLIALDYSDYEIIVVDDSDDSTPIIVSEYKKYGVKLLRPSVRDGRCGARNLGILNADGEVVVILNADVLLPADFLQKIKLHYDEGADYVLVKSSVENLEDLYARYVDAVGAYDFYGSNPQGMEWSEGFSCKRSLAIEAGLFPTGFVVPLVAGEDKIFGENLRALGAKKVIDLNIVCTHIAPASLSEYWYIRKGRGAGTPQVRRFVDEWPFKKIILIAALRVAKTIIQAITVIPMFITCRKYAKNSKYSVRDRILFCWAWLVEKVAFCIGEWQSLLSIMALEYKRHKEKNENFTFKKLYIFFNIFNAKTFALRMSTVSSSQC